MFKIHCPHCQHKLSADATQSGATLQCPACGVDFVIPSPTDEVVIQPQSPEDSAEATASREIQPEQSSQPETSPEPGASHSFAERLRDGYKAAQEGAKFIKKGALVGWAGLKRRSKQAALKVQIEKLRNIDLRKPYHALGKSAFEQGILADQLTERFQAIQDLDAKIAGHREKTSADAGETKMAALIRVSKDTAKSGQAQALTVKREHLITVLGREIHACKEQMSTGDLSDEFSAIDDIENRIRDKEDEVRGLNDGGKSGIQTLAVAAVIGLLVIGAFYGMKMLGGGTRSGEDKATEQKKSTQDVPLTKVPEKKEEPSDARGKDLANKQRKDPQKVVNTEQKAVVRTDLSRWRISGVHLGMSKEQVVKALAESLGPGLQLEKVETSVKNLTCYKPKLNGVEGPLYAGLRDSCFYFAEDGRLRDIILDFEVIKKSSGLSQLETKAFAQQLMQQFGISELQSNAIPTGSSAKAGVVHLLHEAIIPSGSDLIRVAIEEIDGERDSSRRVQIGQVKPLSFGKAGTLFGLRMGMPMNQVTATLKTLLGNNTTLVEGSNYRNEELPEGLTDYDIIAKRDTLGTGERGFVVLDKNGGLCRIFLNSDQLEELSSCLDYAPKSFGKVFMSHFNLGKMDTELQTSPNFGYYGVKYYHSDADFIYIFEMGEYYKYSIYIIKEKNKGNKIKF